MFQLPLHEKDKKLKSSLFSGRMLQTISGLISSWLGKILEDKNARNLFFFLMLNLSFAFVELFYGWWTNSLGLITDACHMFFDCTGLVAGLAATIITKWKPNERFSYGYVRAEVLAGFVNGLFLIFIAFFILAEAVERLMEPPEVKHDRLFIVSVLGFLVNLVGIYAFQHGHSHGGSHGHSHGGSHGHSHGGSHGHSHNNHSANHSHGGYGHSHDHSHDHFDLTKMHSHDDHDSCENNNELQGHNSQIMQGVYLHILADTLGSVGVIISAILMSTMGWMRADPICSMFIAVLISASVMPLLKETIYVLMQRQPRDLDNVLYGTYRKVEQLEGVERVQEPHFWTLCSDVYVGSLKLVVTKNADPRYVVSQTHNIFASVGVKQLYVQLDYPLT